MVIVLGKVSGGLIGLKKVEALDPALEGMDLYLLAGAEGYAGEPIGIPFKPDLAAVLSEIRSRNTGKADGSTWGKLYVKPPFVWTL